MFYIAWFGVVSMIGTWIIATTPNPTLEQVATAMFFYMVGLTTPIIATVAEMFSSPNR